MEVSPNQANSRRSVSPATSVSSLQPGKKKKRNMFHRRSAKKSKEASAALFESDPVDVRPVSVSMDGDSQWMSENDGNTNSLLGRRSLPGGDISSRSSYLVPQESSERKLSMEELGDALVNPSSMWPPPPSPRRKLSADLVERNLSDPLSSMEYMVNVTLVSGHNLAIRDRSGSSDPYVKFKCPPFKYRSAVIHRNLNPEWNEHFSFKVGTLKSQLKVRVYDHDYGALDDFMGGQMMALGAYADNQLHILDVGLEDSAAPKHESLGHLRICLQISPITDKGSPSLEQSSGKVSVTSKAPRTSYKVWEEILNITLLEGCNLPAMDRNGLSDPYCKFKLGTQKVKSQIMTKTLNPKWLERFCLRMLDGFTTLHVEVWDSDFPNNDDFIGSCSVELSDLVRGVAHEFTLPLIGGLLLNDDGTLHFSLTISAARVEEEGVESDAQTEEVHRNYALSQTFNLDAIRNWNVGHLNLKICQVLDLPSCSCYVVAEVGNCCVRTPTSGKTASPSWDKSFNFVVQDLHEELEMKVYKSGSRSDQFLGMVRIPLHRVQSGSHSYMLKGKQCQSQSRGILCVETEFVYQPVRAMLRTLQPRETTTTSDTDTKFQRKLLMGNIKRVKGLLDGVITVMELVQNAFSWENKMLSAVSFVLFLLVVVFGELWMIFVVLVVIFSYQYTVIFIRNGHVWQNRTSSQVHLINSCHNNNKKNINPEDEGSDSSDQEDEKTTIKAKYRLLQSILVIVQKVLGEVADMEEGLRNLVTWKVPFLSWFLMIVLLAAAILLYYVPVRYIVLLVGIKKFSQRLIRPNHIDNNELLDFLSCCPSHKKLEEWRELPLVVYQKQTLLDIRAARTLVKNSKKTQ